jgi:hypothetical protein
MRLLLYHTYQPNRKLHDSHSPSGCSSLANAVPNNLWNVKYKKNHLILNFQDNWQIGPMIHTSDTENPLDMICVPRQQDLTSFSQIALDGAVGPLGTPVLVLR